MLLQHLCFVERVVARMNKLAMISYTEMSMLSVSNVKKAVNLLWPEGRSRSHKFKNSQ